jgi:NAD-dependent deacetylase sirtuin 4
MHAPVTVSQSDALDRLVDLLRDRRIVVLAGAGCSTESGIPDYRGPDGVSRTRAPLQYLEFTQREASRIRYWARSAVGWPRVATAVPNPAHDAIARLEAAGIVAGVITQNVDGLHGKAGSQRVVELHGSLSRVCCLSCGARLPRSDYQQQLLDANPAWARHVEEAETRRGRIQPAPDGDAGVPDHLLEGFEVPPCAACGGICKPDVVFFGENVPAARVGEAWQLFEDADALLVVGSSLTVFSGRRFVYRARDEGRPIAIVNLGPTRCDDLAALKVDGRLGDTLPRVAQSLVLERDRRIDGQRPPRGNGGSGQRDARQQR